MQYLLCPAGGQNAATGIGLAFPHSQHTWVLMSNPSNWGPVRAAKPSSVFVSMSGLLWTTRSVVLPVGGAKSTDNTQTHMLKFSIKSQRECHQHTMTNKQIGKFKSKCKYFHTHTHHLQPYHTQSLRKNCARMNHKCMLSAILHSNSW